MGAPVRLAPIDVAAPVADVLAFFADPTRRPAWQSSLRRVDAVTGADGVGQSWTDVTVVPGVRPRMETTELEEPGGADGSGRWTERGRFGPYSAELTLEVVPTATGSRATPVVRIDGPLALVVRRVAPAAIRGDLRRAARAIEAATNP